ncbi:BnaC06g06540D [Brassica napus]|uniref:BnaC06g06540D protein n=1 Tax=Brassica napus TaxID=3708 RepID=A0A078HFS8_BRANA|nr:BnaC06g06540D [Brassica napus]
MMEKWVVVVVLFTVCIVGFELSFIHGATDASDTSALNTLFSSMHSPAQLTQWTASAGDPCGQNWRGVTCSGTRVTQIKISGLELSGTLGYKLDSLTNLTELDVSSNNLGGDLPYQFPPNLERLNLAFNQFTGAAQYSISQIVPLKYLNLGHNQFKGQIAIDFSKLTSITTLDFSFNSFTESLPGTFTSLTSLKSLYLQNNQFSGTVDVLAGLPLDTLNIANNDFTGWIPSSLKGIDLIKDGNSFSTGPAPPPPPGTPPPPPPHGTPPTHGTPSHKSTNRSSTDSTSNGDSKKSGIGVGVIAGIVISVLVVTALVAFFLVKRRRRSKRSSSSSSMDIEKANNQPHMVAENNSILQSSSSVEAKKLDTSLKPIVVKKSTVVVPSNVRAYSVADLQIATGSFSVDNLLGEGTFGRVYRAEFEDGKVLAVKKIDSSALPHDTTDDFTEIVSKIAVLDHPNVTKLVGYCAEHGQHLLLYEFHSKGSLHDFLHLSDEETKALVWNSRVKVALGTARGLEYLHEVCSPSIVDKNIKSSNILLDSEMNPHLSDSGLASLLPTANVQLLNQTDEGYSAPEVSMSGQYSMKSDVYTFGVVMLELLTGRKPFDSTRSRSEQSLVRWATPQLHDIDALGKMVDPALEGLYPVKSLSRFADVIALCVQAEPEFRPPMSEVVQSLVVLVQRANMSKRTSKRSGSADATNDYM